MRARLPSKEGQTFARTDKTLKTQDDETKQEVGKNLADAISVQTEVANRTWLAMITTAAFSILPHESVQQPNLVTLPFEIGKVSVAVFHPVALSILIVIMIAFAAAQARHLDVQQFAHRLLHVLPSEVPLSQRKIFDITRKPSLLLVSPLAWSLRGQGGSLARWRRIVALIYYVALKALSFLVFYVLPVAALCVEVYNAIRSTANSVVMDCLYIFGAFFAGFAVFQTCWLDMKYAWNVGQRLFDGK